MTCHKSISLSRILDLRVWYGIALISMIVKIGQYRRYPDIQLLPLGMEGAAVIAKLCALEVYVYRGIRT